MIKAVFFDLFNTLIRYDPPAEEHQAWACHECGITVNKADLRRGYWAAQDFYSRENARLSLEKRPPEQRKAVMLEYESTLLREAGVRTSPDLVHQMMKVLPRVKQKLMVFDDAFPTLDTLRQQGLTLGLISNLDKSVDEFCPGLGLSAHLDFTLTSHEVGFDKPHPQIFQSALDRAGIEASEAIHVGDQYHSDVIGAHGAGLKALLLDRDGCFDHHQDCQHIKGLAEVVEFLR